MTDLRTREALRALVEKLKSRAAGAAENARVASEMSHHEEASYACGRSHAYEYAVRQVAALLASPAVREDEKR